MGQTKRSRTQPSIPPPDDLAQVVRHVIAQHPGLALPAVRKKLPRPYQRFPAEVEAATRAAPIVIWRKSAKSLLHFVSDPVSEVEPVLLACLAERPRTESELLGEIDGRLRGHREVAKAWIKAALAEKRLAKHPGKRLRLHDPVADALKATLTALHKELAKLRKAGVPPARIAAVLLREIGIERGAEAERERESKPEPQRVGAAERELLAALRAIAEEHPEGTLLLVREVRARVPAIDKAAFDHAAVQLARSGEVALHAHDFASSLSADERAQLVRDETGAYFGGIAPRSAPRSNGHA